MRSMSERWRVQQRKVHLQAHRTRARRRSQTLRTAARIAMVCLLTIALLASGTAQAQGREEIDRNDTAAAQLELSAECRELLLKAEEEREAAKTEPAKAEEAKAEGARAEAEESNGEASKKLTDEQQAELDKTEADKKLTDKEQAELDKKLTDKEQAELDKIEAGELALDKDPLDRCLPPTNNPVDVEAWCNDLGLLSCSGYFSGLQPPSSSGPLSGTIADSVGVDPSGAANWSMNFSGPLDWDQMGVTFSSQAGDGPLGQGFALAGLSSIERCARTAVSNGVNESIDHYSGFGQANWCLDGTPLELVDVDSNQWVYRATLAGRVETADVITFTANLTGSLEAWIEVVHKGGARDVYRPVIVNNRIINFLRTYREDPFANATTWYYDIDINGSTISSQLAQVAWGGSASVYTGLGHLYAANFEWGQRNDRSRMAGGITFRNDSRLDRVEVVSLDGIQQPNVMTGGTQVFGQGAQWATQEELKEYTFSYTAPTHDSRIYLDAIELCEGSNLCYPETTFSWAGLKGDTDTNALAATEQDYAASTISTSNPIIGGVPHSYFNYVADGLSSPYQITKANAIRGFDIDSSGRIQADNSVAGVDIPLVSLSGWYKADGPGIDGRINFTGPIVPTNGYDILRLFNDVDYFHAVTEAGCLFAITWQQIQGDSDGNGGSERTYCGVTETSNAQNPWPANSPITCAANAGSAQNRENCMIPHQDFIGTASFNNLHDAFSPALSRIAQAAGKLNGDYDGDGLSDELRLHIYDNGVGDRGIGGEIFYGAGGSGNAPGLWLALEYWPDFSWGSLDNSGANDKFVKVAEKFVRNLTDGFAGIMTGDFNGDGRTDVYQIYGQDGDAEDRVYYSSGGVQNTTFQLEFGPTTWQKDVDGAFSDTTRATERLRDKARVSVINFDGDRCQDIAYLNGYNTDPNNLNGTPDAIHLSPCPGSRTSWTEISGVSTLIRAGTNGSKHRNTLTDVDIAGVKYGDFNGDGCSDVLEVGNPQTTNGSDDIGRIHFSNCRNGFVTGPTAPFIRSYDGKDEYSDETLSSWTTFTDSDHSWTHDLNEQHAVRVVDINGDGLSDIYVFDTDGAVPSPDRDRVFLNRGSGTFAPMSGAATQIGRALGSWSEDSQVAFDLGRHHLIPMGNEVLPGMLFGGALLRYAIADDNDGYDAASGGSGFPSNAWFWFMGDERFGANGFEIPELRTITDGLGHRSEFSYQWYREGDDARAVARVVSGLRTDAAPQTVGGQVVDQATLTSFAYQDLEIDRVRGSLGFGRITTETALGPWASEQTVDGMTRVTTGYHRGDHLIGLPNVTVTELAHGCATTCQWTRIGEVRNRMRAVQLNTIPAFSDRDDFSVRIEPWTTCTGSGGYWGRTMTWDHAGQNNVATSTCHTTGPIDEWGNPAWVETATADGRTTRTSFTYSTPVAQRHGLATSTTTQTTDVGGAQDCTVDWVGYDDDTLDATLAAEIFTTPLVKDDCTTTGVISYRHVEFDLLGRMTQERIGGTNVPARITDHTYGSGRLARFLTSTTVYNDTGTPITTSFSIDPGYEFASAATATDANGVTTTVEVDDAGRLTSKTNEATDTVSYIWGDTPSPTVVAELGGFRRSWTSSTNGETGYQVTDSFGRTVRTAAVTPAGIVVNDFWFDDQGRTVETSLPYVVQDPNTVDATRVNRVDTFDPLGRPLMTTSADGLVSEYIYDMGGWLGTPSSPYPTTPQALWVRGHSVTVDGVESQTFTDAAGRLLATRNAAGEVVYYDHHPDGAIRAVRDAQGNEITTVRDNWGRTTSMTDPDIGTWTYEHNALDEQTRIIDGAGNLTELTYDDLGRSVEVAVRNPDGSVYSRESVTHDSAANGLGLPAVSFVETASDGVSLSQSQTPDTHLAEYSYDTYARPSLVRTEMSVDGQGSQSHEVSTAYDTFGRVFEVSYGTELTVRSQYHADSGAAVGAVQTFPRSILWRTAGYDASGTPVLFENRNNTATLRQKDLDTGHLNRVEVRSGLQTIEELRYDWNVRGNLNSRQNVRAGTSENFTYDDLDRMRTSQRLAFGPGGPVGEPTVEYGFDNIGNMVWKSDYATAPYEYSGAGNAGPHAVSAIDTTTFIYDDAGNMVRELEGALNVVRSMTYNARNQLVEARLNGANPATLDVAYGLGGAKIWQTTATGSDSTKTWYLSDTWRLEDDAAGQRSIINVSTGAGEAIEFVTTGATTRSRWVHTDHLGSPSLITDDGGGELQRQSFTPFGAPRAVTPAGPLADSLIESGFTGHDRLDDLGLINMIARMYDPAMGRFIQADTVVQDTVDNQALARYSYTRHNPLRYTDPTGHSWQSLAILAAQFGLSYLTGGAYQGQGITWSPSSYGTGAGCAACGPASGTSTSSAGMTFYETQRLLVVDFPAGDSDAGLQHPALGNAPKSVGASVIIGEFEAGKMLVAGETKSTSFSWGLSFSREYRGTTGGVSFGGESSTSTYEGFKLEPENTKWLGKSGDLKLSQEDTSSVLVKNVGIQVRPVLLETATWVGNWSIGWRMHSATYEFAGFHHRVVSDAGISARKVPLSMLDGGLREPLSRYSSAQERLTSSPWKVWNHATRAADKKIVAGWENRWYDEGARTAPGATGAAMYNAIQYVERNHQLLQWESIFDVRNPYMILD